MSKSNKERERERESERERSKAYEASISLTVINPDSVLLCKRFVNRSEITIHVTTSVVKVVLFGLLRTRLSHIDRLDHLEKTSYYIIH